MSFEKHPQFVETDPTNSWIGRYVLKLVSHTSGPCHSVGTATILAPGIALTARHVVQQSLREHGATVEEPGSLRADWMLHALQFGDAKVVNDWRVDLITESEYSDLALLRVPGAGSWESRDLSLAIRLAPPKAGDRVVGFGYTGVAERRSGTELVVDPAARTTVGEVLEVFPRQRDRSRAPFPCFHINCRFDDAMSGGPVFHDDGALVGVISSTYPPSEPGQDHASYAALVWPVLGLSPKVPWLGWHGEGEYVLYDYYRANPNLTHGTIDWVERLPDGTWKIRTD